MCLLSLRFVIQCYRIFLSVFALSSTQLNLFYISMEMLKKIDRHLNKCSTLLFHIKFIPTQLANNDKLGPYFNSLYTRVLHSIQIKFARAHSQRKREGNDLTDYTYLFNYLPEVKHFIVL